MSRESGALHTTFLSAERRGASEVKKSENEGPISRLLLCVTQQLKINFA